MEHKRLLVSALILAFCANTLADNSRVNLLRTPNDGIQPQAAVDAKGILHLIYYKGGPKGGDIFYVRREPAQTAFSKPIQVNTQTHTAMAMGTIRGAQLA